MRINKNQIRVAISLDLKAAFDNVSLEKLTQHMNTLKINKDSHKTTRK